MKRIISLILVVILCCALTACGENKPSTDNGNNQSDYVPSGNATANKDYFEWSTSDDTAIVGYTAEGLKQTELVIPADCTSVKGLGENETVKQITFESPDTQVDAMAFNNCINLQYIELPSNLQEIAYYSFYNCQNLKSVSLPGGIVSIGHDAFSECVSLETVTLGSKLVNIDRNAFTNCASLKSVSLPDSVETVGKAAFEGCSSLTEVSFGTGLKSVEESAFKSCVSLKSVKLQEGVTELGIWAFAYCDALEEIYLPKSISSIEVSSIAQTHKVEVYVVSGSYVDQQLDNLMSPEFYDKQYQ